VPYTSLTKGKREGREGKIRSKGKKETWSF
jgi:hypothetical protein